MSSAYPYGSPTDPKFDSSGRIIDEENPGPRPRSPPPQGRAFLYEHPPQNPPPFHIHPYYPHGKGRGKGHGHDHCPGSCATASRDRQGQQLVVAAAAPMERSGEAVGERTGSASSLHSAGSMSSSIPSVPEDYGGGGGAQDGNPTQGQDDKLGQDQNDLVKFGGGGGTDDGDNSESTGHTHGKRAVVRIRNAHKRYSRKGPKVMNGFGMTVEEGTIYSLLGSSGCGKTTTLACILGMRYLDKGDISVFGKRPGSKGSEVPGRRAGYMPQEIALYGLFSIDETLHYYGRLYGMTGDEIRARRDFLIAFLDLPERSRRCNQLSSGQQRRVSFAAALIHSPGLLVLDEPTVGVDALLRERIWAYLKQLVTDQGTTIIITTHYIEEARSSDTIGLMRGGRLLEENDPLTLLKMYHAVLLEEIVLALCRNDTSGSNEDGRGGVSSSTTLASLSNPRCDKDHCAHEQQASSDRERRESITSWVSNNEIQFGGGQRATHFQRVSCRVRALILKKVFIMWRNILLVLFMVLTPSLMVLLICNGIGNDPKPIPLGVVNHEASMATCDQLSKWKSDGSGAVKIGCDMQHLSCKYLDRIPTDSIILKEYESEYEAHQAVVAGKVWGYVSFPAEYSDNLVTRTFGGGGGVSTEILTKSFITYQLDMSSKLIGGFVKQTLAETYQTFLQTLLSNCGLNPLLGERPVKAMTPIYGQDNTDLREYIAPSCLLGFLFFFPMCCTSVLYIMDKKQGTLERARVAGVHTSEIMVSYFLVEGIVLVIKLALSLTIICIIYGFEIKGSIPLLVAIYMLMGIGGVSAGFLLASFCNEEVQAVLLAMAAFFPNFLLSGLLWPIESMPYAMQYMTYILPCTFPAEAVRSIMSRGWGIGNNHVWPGLVTVIAWPLVYWALTVLVHRITLRRR